MNFPIFVPKGEVSELLSPLRRHILTVSGQLKNGKLILLHQKIIYFILHTPNFHYKFPRILHSDFVGNYRKHRGRMMDYRHKTYIHLNPD